MRLLHIAVLVPVSVFAYVPHSQHSSVDRKSYADFMTQKTADEDGSHNIVLDVMEDNNKTLVLIATRSPWTRSAVSSYTSEFMVQWKSLGFKRILFVHMATDQDAPETIYQVGKGEMAYFADFKIKGDE